MRSGRPMTARLNGVFEATWQTLLDAVDDYACSSPSGELALGDADRLQAVAETIRSRILEATPVGEVTDE